MDSVYLMDQLLLLLKVLHDREAPYRHLTNFLFYFPLWGTCLSFEILSVLTFGTDSVLSGVNAENISLYWSLWQVREEGVYVTFYSINYFGLCTLNLTDLRYCTLKPARMVRLDIICNNCA